MTTHEGWQELTLELFRRVRAELAEVLAEDDPARVAAGGNSVGWLVWHVLRGQDRNLSEVAGTPQLWVSGWAERFGRPADPADTGYGHTRAEAGAFAAARDQLAGYAEAVQAMIEQYLAGAPEGDLRRVAASSTLGTADTVAERLAGQLQDSFMHLGQIRG
ncbi:DinB family protein [Streptomyces sp. NPDC002054]|uniref:DinB family protein n=1 Tax=Streptomyces sp. NPDC002054 TaxID=3154663 RepID=UPI003332EE69